MKLLAMMILLIASTLQATETGFMSGNNFEKLNLNGKGFIYCSGQNSTYRYFSCNYDVLTPKAFDYFVIDHEVDADRVVLTALREDGTTRTKTAKFKASKNRSKKRFNLWIASLLQRPLLKDGVNLISYSLQKRRKVVEEGQFEAIVEDGERRKCRYARINSTGPYDCSSDYNACQKYFEVLNYCK